MNVHGATARHAHLIGAAIALAALALPAGAQASFTEGSVVAAFGFCLSVLLLVIASVAVIVWALRRASAPRVSVEFTCLFCGRGWNQGVRLHLGQSASICSGCATAASALLEDGGSASAPVQLAGGSTPSCAFCKSHREVPSAIVSTSAPGIGICDECLAKAANALGAGSPEMRTS